MISFEYEDEYGVLQPGATRVIQHNSTSLKFDIIATLESLSPESWRVKVALFGEELFAMQDSFPSKMAAGSAAGAALRQHLIRILRG